MSVANPNTLRNVPRFDASTKVGATPLPQVPVSVVIIAKDCADGIKRTISSLRELFLRECDEVLVLDTGSADDATCLAAEELGARVVRRNLAVDVAPYVERWLPDLKEAFEKSILKSGCILDFGEARRAVAELAAHDVQFWIDSDDVLVEREPGKLRATIDRQFSEGRGTSIFLEYLYAFDKNDGAVTTTLKRERVYDRRLYRWVGRCHETAIPVDGCATSACWYHDLCAAVKHEKLREDEGVNASDIRNYVILRKEVEDTSPDVDPRTIFYLGNAARGLGRDAEAVDLYNRFIPISGSRDDRFAAAYYVGCIYLGERSRRPVDALDYGFLCCRLRPEDPRGPYLLSRAYFQMRRFNECLHWFKVGRLLPQSLDNTTHSYDPSHVTALPLQIAVAAAKELGGQEQAAQLVEELAQVRPNHPDTKTVRDYVGNWLAERRLVEGARAVLANSCARDRDQLESRARALASLLPQLPDELEDNGICPLEVEDGREGKDLVFWCGQAPEPFGPHVGKAGVGGSEKAVVQMAGRMQARGFRVTVYANVPRAQRGIAKDGVRWEHFGAFDRRRPRGAIVFWRSPEALELPVAAERRVVWCHDVQDPNRWTPARVALADQVWVLSEYHAATLGHARVRLGNKVVVTRNGVDADLFKKILGGNIPRDPTKIVYASSPDRGVLRAIGIFSLAKDKLGLPEESKLHVYYGFTPFYLKMAAENEYRGNYDLGRDCSMYDYMKMVLRAADARDDVMWHGRVGWEEMAREMCSAGAFLYPTKFPEISCMALMEAQAAGLVPVCSGTAALSETWGGPYIDDDTDNAAVALVKAACCPADDEQRKVIHEAALKRFSYEALADEWVKLLS